jgi:hypothetical protein
MMAATQSAIVASRPPVATTRRRNRPMVSVCRSARTVALVYRPGRAGRPALMATEGEWAEPRPVARRMSDFAIRSSACRRSRSTESIPDHATACHRGLATDAQPRIVAAALDSRALRSSRSHGRDDRARGMAQPRSAAPAKVCRRAIQTSP